ncbi:ATP-binding protein [Acanthopleuribacter pedis]|uniref:ATP-binding protein n=1 Tax=Acanthopleuribacter pedis TaxID=442870 RepID=A0A8J7Q1N5_9BACT|nr:ATP-binding protein [Acanthopleuribacter pedis]MBO1317610.1 ATP-binding protein [Acanthopleuribacter pedis]
MHQPLISNLTHQIQFQIDSNLEDVALAGVSVRALCNHFEMGSEVAYQVELCVVEMLNNVIEHGYKFQKGHDIKVRFGVGDGRLEVIIIDEAEPMGGTNEPRLCYDIENIESIPENGYGRYLVKQIMDQVDYRTERGSNYLSMVKSLS